jgi:hypothetical protein
MEKKLSSIWVRLRNVRGAAANGPTTKEADEAVDLRTRTAGQGPAARPFAVAHPTPRPGDRGRRRAATKEATSEGMCNVVCPIMTTRGPPKQLASLSEFTLSLDMVHKEIAQLGLIHNSPDQWPVGGRLAHCQGNWRRITQDPVILQAISGYEIDFLTQPPPSSANRAPRFSTSEQEKISTEVEKMLAKRAIEQVAETADQWVSSLFLRPQKDGSMRPIFNLKKLNSFVRYQHFKMENIGMLRDMLQEGDWMVKIDLKDAYFTVPMAKETRKFLRFRWGGKTFQFRVAPFGLAPIPRMFTKILKPIVAMLRRIGIRLLIYLDDLIIMNQKPGILLKDLHTTIWLVQCLGFMINWAKSVLIPTQEIMFLGFSVNSIRMMLALPEEKIKTIQAQCQEMLSAGETTVRTLAQLVGKLTASVLAVLPAPLHYRQLQMLQAKSLLRSNQSYEGQVTLTSGSKDELQWWIYSLQEWNGKAIASSSPDLIITTDSSKIGWGAECQGETTQGQWSVAEATKHINVLELTAAYFAVKAFTSERTVKHVHLRVDNKVTMAQINKMGGPRSWSLMEVTLPLWQYCLSRGITLTAEYLEGRLNVIADRESRVFNDMSDWKLLPSIFKQIEGTLGQTEVDLFANRLNTQKKYL